VKTIVVWFSCGAASAVAAKKTLEKYGDTHIVRVVNNPIKEEHPDNMRFLKDVQKWLGVTIEFSLNEKYPDASCVDVWRDQKFMGSVKGANCTMVLKKQARQQWEKRNKFDHVVLGFTADEKKRHDNFCLTEREILPVLIDAGITKNDCFEIIKNAGIELPMLYRQGFPNANCIGCVKATSPTYWNLVREKYPDIFEQRRSQADGIGAKLVRYKGKRISLTNLPPEAKGRKLKSMNFECGIFCEERIN